MTDKAKCQNCKEADSCKDLYRCMGQSAGPSVALKVVTAFVIPICIFIVSLLVFEPVLARFVKSSKLIIILNFLVALSITSVIMLTIKLIYKVFKHK